MMAPKMNTQAVKTTIITAEIVAALSGIAQGQEAQPVELHLMPGQNLTRPNILFIMADDHAWQAVSAYGESRHLIQTPNIDRLAR